MLLRTATWIFLLHTISALILTKPLFRQCHCDFPGDPECPPMINMTLGIPEQSVTLEFHITHLMHQNFVIYRNYDKDESTTYKKLGVESENGTLMIEALHLGDHLLRNFSFTYAPNNATDRETSPADGLIVFDFVDKDGQLSHTPNQLLSHFTEPKISIWLSPVHDRSKNTMGQVTFGGIDLVNCGPVAMWVHPLPPMFPEYKPDWTVKVDGFAVGDDEYNIVHRAVIQLERDNIEVPARIFRVIMLKTGARRKKYRFRRGLEQHMVSCRMREKGPVIYFSIEDKEFAIPPDQYILESGFGDGCALAVTAAVSKTKTIRLGRPFLRQYCTVLDYEGRIGFTEREYISDFESGEDPDDVKIGEVRERKPELEKVTVDRA